ncbi:TetR/AcrR family transcriptional regulator [Neobacillus pocheonensis]|uniref:TetR/AcrR family transcriptional regulator n=1 Tax=Neobacillus pocheonensis TaxID=363869 RepID=UPI003D26C354
MENRKVQIIDLAMQLIQQKGYVAFSYDDISKQLGVTKASIHYHFEKKEDLGAAITDRIMQRLDRFSNSNASIASLSPKEKLEKFFTDRMERFSCYDICPISSLQTDFESLPEAMQKKVKEISEKELLIITNILREIQEQGDLQSSDDVESLALMILAASKGVLQYQRVLGKDFFADFMKQVSNLTVK